MGWCDFWEENLEELPGFGTPIACQAKDAAKEEIAEAAASAWEEIVHSFQEGAVWMVKELALGWLRADSPTLAQDSGTVAFLFSSTLAITQWLAVLSLLVAAGHMAWTRRAEPAREAAAAILRLIVATSAAVAVVNLLAKAGDAFSVWIVNRSLGCPGAEATDACVKAFSSKLLDMTALNDVDQLAVSLVVAILLLLSGLVQLISVIVRQAMLFILVGTLPLAAAASGTEQGRAWWKKSVGWILAFLAFKPAAAIAYAAAFSQFSTGDKKDLLSQLYGVTLLILTGLTLPALMRFIAPVVDQGGLGGEGKSTSSMAARVATGAIALKTGGAAMAGRGAAASGAARAGGGAGGASGSGAAGAGGGGRPGGGRPGGAPSGGGSGGGSGSGGGAAPASAPAPTSSGQGAAGAVPRQTSAPSTSGGSSRSAGAPSGAKPGPRGGGSPPASAASRGPGGSGRPSPAGSAPPHPSARTPKNGGGPRGSK
ncbi:hypothetical protein E3E14_07155 [Streptomyces sp. ICN441]|uniref:hypothetical protein n=1 Tax=Streptomyces sp. ICN441 TaxID=2558286 RepID=UPI00106C9DFA|nr:hypothetical protein [Streptomyces sp. ICN441]TFE54699.1 hypothetical protein E3E14_07155 [Streptomyces sp. ICN441]